MSAADWDLFIEFCSEFVTSNGFDLSTFCLVSIIRPIMALYYISYDLDKPGQDYSDLINRLKQLGAIRILKSDWLLGNDSTNPDQIANDLLRSLDANDRIFVGELHNNASWRNLMASDEVVLGLFNKYARR